jgi:urease accessory protein
VVGGDRLELEVRCGAGSEALLTTPAAAKFYRSAGPEAVQTQVLHVAAGSALEWLPQENILFPGARVGLHTRVEVARGGCFLGWEIHCLGRPVNRETFRCGRVDARLELRAAGVPLLRERLLVENERDLVGAAGLRGLPVVATLLATPANGVHLELARACLRETSEGVSGATLVDTLLLVRHLGPSTEQARRALVRTWSALRPPLLGRDPCPPRIWAT